MRLRINVDTSEAEAVARVIKHLPRDLKRELTVALRKSATAVARKTRRLLRSQRRGRSRPGQPPARQTGALARSIRTKKSRSGLSYSITASVFYATVLEAGAEGAGRGRANRIEPRPFLTAALEDLEAENKERIAKAVRDVFRQAALRVGR
jgi:phage gpG-like protein